MCIRDRYRSRRVKPISTFKLIRIIQACALRKSIRRCQSILPASVRGIGQSVSSTAMKSFGSGLDLTKNTSESLLSSQRRANTNAADNRRLDLVQPNIGFAPFAADRENRYLDGDNAMRMPNVHGVIRRRLLVNFRVDPAVIRRWLPSPFQPKLQDGHAVAGICLIRLEQIRPKFVPSVLGISSENAAHRIAVTWEDATGPHEGVYIPRRDSNSM